jgi:hypothetical protein
MDEPPYVWPDTITIRMGGHLPDDPFPVDSLFDMGMPEDIGPDPDALTEEEFEKFLGLVIEEDGHCDDCCRND